MTPRVLAVLLTFALALPSAALRAQSTATLSGRVTLDGMPTSDVAVYLVGTTRGASTGADGRYQITGIAPATTP